MSEAIISCAEFIDVMTSRARGKRINYPRIQSITFIEPLPYEEPEEDLDDDTTETSEEDNSTVENVDYAIAQAEMENITVEPIDNQDSGTGEQMTLDF